MLEMDNDVNGCSPASDTTISFCTFSTASRPLLNATCNSAEADRYNLIYLPYISRTKRSILRHNRV